MMGNTALNTLWPGDETLIFIYGSMKNPIGKLLLPCVIIWESILIIASVYRSSVCNKGIQFHFIWYFPNFFFCCSEKSITFPLNFSADKIYFPINCPIFNVSAERCMYEKFNWKVFCQKQKNRTTLKQKVFLCVC